MKIILRGENQDNIRDILLRALKLDDSETLDEVLIIEGEMGDQLMVHLKKYQYIPNKMMGCSPKCAGFSWRINSGQDHWGVCTKHKTKWFIGSDLWGDWRETTSEKGLKLLASCRKVEFVTPEDPHPSNEIMNQYQDVWDQNNDRWIQYCG